MEPLAIVADWLTNATYGVNAMIDLIPDDDSEGVPADVTVGDETRDAWVARRLIPKDRENALMVVQSGEATSDGTARRAAGSTTAEVGGTVDVLVLYVVRKSASDAAILAAKTILRAVKMSLVLLNDPANGASRVRNGVILGPCTGFRQMAMQEEIGESLATGGIIASYTTRENVALIN